MIFIVTKIMEVCPEFFIFKETLRLHISYNRLENPYICFYFYPSNFLAKNKKIEELSEEVKRLKQELKGDFMIKIMLL